MSLRRKTVGAIALFLIMTALSTPQIAHAAELGHLRKLAGQYTDVLLADPALDAELHLVLGDDYDSFMTVMQVVFPTTLVDGRYIVAEGCRAHDCGNQSGLLVIDLDAGSVMALRRGLYGFVGATSPALDALIAGWRVE